MTEKDETEMVDKRAGRDTDGGGRDEAGVAATGDETPNTQSELAEAREKAETFYKNWQRSAADFINYKRRVEQERGENARLAGAAMVINILPIYDDLDRAVSNVDAGLAGLNWVQGVVAIHQKFGRLLEAMNVHEVEAEGKDFDPAQHEAIGQQPGPEGKVLQVVQKGYMLGDKVIRPAMVIVGNG
ncbi:MAG TPA: nucleotide exchange factor GrpE [Tepidiformaceae bacterium]|nr:nucleotide exchange factor GrpE [Tepidiformaceae bacterium]